jgi:hypothetical protein
VPLLDMRVKELSAERQESARRFAASIVEQTRAELGRLLRERREGLPRAVSRLVDENPCEPAD